MVGVRADAALCRGSVRDDHRFLVDLGLPRQVGLAVPLPGLRLLVELAQRGTSEVVVPGEQRVGVVLDRVLDGVDVGVGDGEDGLDVVDVVAADHVGDLSAHDAAFW